MSLAHFSARKEATDFSLLGRFKLHTDYVAAATKGAQAAVLGNIPAVNPVDPPETHMFVWNNMFLSFATNSRGIFTELGGEEAAHAAANNDLRGVRAFSSIRNSGLYVLVKALNFAPPSSRP